MSSGEVVESYLRGEISRRTLIRRLVAAGVSFSAAVAYSELLRPSWAYASHECTAEYYDLHGFYGDCGNHDTTPPPQDPPPEEKKPDNPPAPTPDTTAPATLMKLSRLSLASLLLTGRLVLDFTSSEAGTVSFTVTTGVPGRSAAAEASRRVVVARGTTKFAAPGKKRVRLKLSRRGRKLLAKRRRASLRVTARAVDRSGNARVRSVSVKLH
ncbi:MAG TPA: hypothetical protein VK486_16010 [Thermoleophilaceae bacterium]|nr:hypothetical protein [Thermoleophilaceae bacterium]